MEFTTPEFLDRAYYLPPSQIEQKQQPSLEFASQGFLGHLLQVLINSSKRTWYQLSLAYHRGVSQSLQTIWKGCWNIFVSECNKGDSWGNCRGCKGEKGKIKLTILQFHSYHEMQVLDGHRFLSQIENTSQESLHLSQEPFVVDIQVQWHHASVLLRSTAVVIASWLNKRNIIWIKCSEVTNTNTSYEKFHKQIITRKTLLEWKQGLLANKNVCLT